MKFKGSDSLFDAISAAAKLRGQKEISAYVIFQLLNEGQALFIKNGAMFWEREPKPVPLKNLKLINDGTMYAHA